MADRLICVTNVIRISVVTFQKGVTLFVNKQPIPLALMTVYVGCERDGLLVYEQGYALLKIYY